MKSARAALLVLLLAAPSGAEPALTAVATGDWWYNSGDGGLRGGSRRLDNIILSLDLPLSEFTGRESGRLRATGLYNSGNRFSAEVLGDAQIVSNIEAAQATRIFELYYEYGSREDRSSLLFGYWDLNSEIDVIDPAGLFLNSSQGIGAEFGTSGKNGPSIFPITSLSLRYRYRVNDRLTLRAAILDGAPGNSNNPGRTITLLGEGEGALLVGEAEYRMTGGVLVKGGLWRYTTRREVVDDSDAGAFSEGIYGSLSGALSWLQSGTYRPIEGYLRAGIANGDVQRIAGYLGAGLVYRPASTADLGVAYGMAASTAFTGEDSRTQGADRLESALELTVSAQPTPWLRLQPNVQYVINPGFDPSLDNALVLGLRLELSGSLAL